MSETRYPHGSHLPRHSHELHYFGFVLSGWYKERYERKVRSCEPLMILYHPAGELHAQSFDMTAVNLFRIEVNPARLQYLSPNLFGDSRDFRGGQAVGLANKLYQEFKESDAVSHLAIEGLGLELVATLARDSQRRINASRQQPPRWLGQARELIKARYLEHFTLNDIADSVGVHPVTLAREFRRHYHCTVGELVRRERIDFACRELVKPEASIAGVADSARFFDQSHFAKVFKRIIGITPGRYRDRFSSR